jgi:hypothetical protein
MMSAGVCMHPVSLHAYSKVILHNQDYFSIATTAIEYQPLLSAQLFSFQKNYNNAQMASSAMAMPRERL